MINFSLAPIFSDYVVFQQNAPIRIFGKGDQEVLVTLGDVTKKVKPINGKWLVEFDPLSACDYINFEVSSNDETLVIKNAAIGEVWLGSGQSNMEFEFKYDYDFKKEYGKMNNYKFRFYNQANISYDGQINDGNFEKDNKWVICSKENAHIFSAVSYYFGQELSKAFPDTIIAVVTCDWGGTSASSWIDPKYFEVYPELKIYLDEYQRHIDNIDDLEEHKRLYKALQSRPQGKELETFSYWVNSHDLSLKDNYTAVEFFKYCEEKYPNVPLGPLHPQCPSTLYKHMLLELSPFSFKGVLWYQGEADERHCDLYDTLLTALIKTFRDTFINDTLPFIIVELAPFHSIFFCETGVRYPIIRKQQEKVANTLNDTYSICIMDVGAKYDIHPKKKKPVGNRLALKALGKVYSFPILCDSPIVKNYEFNDNKVSISFDYVGEGLKLKGKRINALEVINNVNKKVNYEYIIEKDQIIIFGENINKVKFAMLGYVKVNLYNSALLPVKPFEITKNV